MSFLPKLRSTSASRLRFSKYAINLRAFSYSAGVYQEHEILRESKVDFETKYAEKLQKRAQEQGKSVLELRLQLKEEEKERRRQRLAAASLGPPGLQGSLDAGVPSSASPSAKPSKVGVPVRKDSSPVKPLASILNLDRLLERPHTAEQVSLLWRAYHASRSGGTGRGFLCASIPVDTYEKMMIIGQKYSSFVVPVPRDNAQTKEDVDRAYEFFLMEWGFHGAPPELSTSRDLFAAPKPSNNPQISTILFTPLQEYKMRTSFATPYLALTHYTDLARSHGVVLLRGELTPSAANSAGVGAGGNDGRYMLSQQDAQLLAMCVQRFYLWTEGSDERAALVKAFHETPADFKWEDLLTHAVNP